MIYIRGKKLTFRVSKWEKTYTSWEKTYISFRVALYW